MKEFQPQNEEATIRVLLYGPVGVGKSSFINSVNNVLQGRMTNEPLASATTSDQSFTKMYKTYKIKKEGRGNFYPFVFSDIMGLEEGSGVRTGDIKLALKGHVKDGYKKMREIREAASDLNIPQLVILTHIDAACGETERDLRNIYRSKYLKKKMGDFNSSLGIPMKNYNNVTELDSDVDSLILKLMIDFGDDNTDKL